MKRVKKWLLDEGGIIPVLFVFLVLGLLGAATWQGMPLAKNGVAKFTTTFANAQRDTITYVRTGGVAAINFALHTKDSLSITEIYVRRMVGGELTADSTRLVGATVNVAAGISGTAANPSFAASYAITMTPLPDTYVVIVVYAGSANGVTSPNVDYFMQTQNYNE